jgi:hypothetical protein
VTVATPAELLGLAGAVSDGRHPIPGMSQSRAVCLILRQALEQIVDALLAEKDLGCPAATMRARLICLSVSYGKDAGRIGYRAGTAWSRLSAACHHHAYELSPTRGEARGLLDDVTWLSEQLTNRRERGASLRPSSLRPAIS